MDLTLGARLRMQREERHIPLQTIAADTKINPSFLEALERDDLSHWPTGIFQRAYVMAYASAIGLEPDAVLREVRSLQGK
jgi:cytoskeletal protein RodZ